MNTNECRQWTPMSPLVANGHGRLMRTMIAVLNCVQRTSIALWKECCCGDGLINGDIFERVYGAYLNLVWSAGGPGDAFFNVVL